MDWLVGTSIIVTLFFLCKYAIEEGQRSERQKEFEKNLKDWDKKYKTK